VSSSHYNINTSKLYPKSIAHKFVDKHSATKSNFSSGSVSQTIMDQAMCHGLELRDWKKRD
jgi:hypothetical protein